MRALEKHGVGASTALGAKSIVGAEGGVVVVGLALGAAQDCAPLDGLTPFLTESRVRTKQPICAVETRSELG